MNLSDHFTLAEMVASATARRLGIDNTPSFGVIQNLARLCKAILEPLRAHINSSHLTPIIINSGFRCEELNRAVGGTWNSNHLYGYAADIHVNSIEEGREWFCWIRDNCEFDELIWECSSKHGGKASPSRQASAATSPSRGTRGKPFTFWIHVAYRHNRNRRKVIDFLEKTQ